MGTDRFSATLVAGRSSLTTHATSMPPTRGRTSPAPHRIPRTAPILAGLIVDVPDVPARKRAIYVEPTIRAAVAQLNRLDRASAAKHARARRHAAAVAAGIDRTKSTPTPARPRRGTGRSAVA